MGSRNEPNGEDGKEKVMSSIENKLNSFPQQTINCCIYKVPRILRNVNNEAYTPQLVSIGPFHHGAKRLQPMEGHKLRYLKDFLLLGLEPENNIAYFVKVLRRLEVRARECYAEVITLDSDEFVEMMLIDSCFIIVFMLKSCDKEPRDNNDAIFLTTWMDAYIKEDAVLLENQLPFFVIEHLFDLINGPHQIVWKFSLLDLSLQFFQQRLRIGQEDVLTLRDSRNYPKHFVDLLRRCYIPSLPPGILLENCDVHFIPSATELREAGVNFKKATSNCFLDLNFRNRVLNIPPLHVIDSTELRLRSLIAFEQLDEDSKYISDYAVLMDSLINTPQDVALLRSCGIIKNWLGDNEEVSLLFNNLVKGVIVRRDKFHYRGLCEDVNAYYKIPSNVWRAKLKRDYFNTPWSTLSVIAAILLLSCAILQTVFTIIS